MAASRSNRNRRKRRRRRNLILSIMSLIFLSLLGYATYEYIAGKNEAIEAQGKENPSGETKDSSQDYEDDFKGTEDKEGKTNVLILGVDSRGNEIPRSDTIMIGQYDPKSGTAKLASIMRDTYVNIPGYGYNKINAAFAYGGPELLRQTIKNNFGIDVEYYSIVDFQGFTHIVDTIAPDGIKINVEKRMEYHDGAGTINIDLYPGVQNLNGDQLLGYARFRHDSESDFGRVRRQQQVIERVKDELISFSGIAKFPKIVGMLEPYISTNMGKTKILALGGKFMLHPVDQIDTMRIPVEGSYWNEQNEHAGAYLAINEADNKQALKEFFGVTATPSTNEQ